MIWHSFQKLKSFFSINRWLKYTNIIFSIFVSIKMNINIKSNNKSDVVVTAANYCVMMKYIYSIVWPLIILRCSAHQLCVYAAGWVTLSISCFASRRCLSLFLCAVCRLTEKGKTIELAVVYEHIQSAVCYCRASLYKSIK